MFGNQFQQIQQPYQGVFGYQQQQTAPSFMEVESVDSINMIRLQPMTKAVFFDKHKDVFYTAETDAAGMKHIESYEFAPAKQEQEVKYLTTTEFDEWRSKIEQLISGQANQHGAAIQGQGVHPRVPAGSHAATGD